MKPLKFVAITVVAVLFLSLAAIPVRADAPDVSGVSTVPSTDNQKHAIPATTAQWYRFDYAVQDDGTRPNVDLAMLDGSWSGLAFEVWTATQLANLATTYEDAVADPVHNQSIGRGTA